MEEEQDLSTPEAVQSPAIPFREADTEIEEADELYIIDEIF